MLLSYVRLEDVMDLLYEILYPNPLLLQGELVCFYLGVVQNVMDFHVKELGRAKGNIQEVFLFPFSHLIFYY